MAQSWRTVRVFISSTFRDMHAERDHLVRVVFPELKERCRKRHVQLIDVDLRWGVTQEQAEGGGALDICLDEIDSCRPYFLGLLGHRYGTVPPGHDHSITAQEVYHGVLHNSLPRQLMDLRPFVRGILEGRTLYKEQVETLVRCYQWNPEKKKHLLQPNITPEDEKTLCSVFDQYSLYQQDRSFFFLRSESFTRKLAGSNVADFFETDGTLKSKLQTLKQEIKDAGLPGFEYKDLESLGQKVLETLWGRIDAEFPEKREEGELDWLAEEAEFHELFMADRTRRFVGRSDVLKNMHGFVEKDSEPRLMVVTGEPGCGKSALMARFTEEVIHHHPDWLILSHFVGASPSSTSLRLTLRRLCTQLYQSCDFETQKRNKLITITGNDEQARLMREAVEKEFAVPDEYQQLATTLHGFLEKAASQREILIIMDAVNQLERADNTHSMAWLPQNLPQNVKVVVSTLAGEVFDCLKARHIQPRIQRVSGLKEDEIRQLAAGYLEEIRREFPTEDITQAFYEKVKAGNPLYITVALEELRVFPYYERLGKRVAELPETVPELFNQVLERVEGDFNRPLVQDFTSFIACGRQGMTADELQTLLKGHAPVVDPAKPPVRFPDMLFARLRRAFAANLFERSGVIDFFHGQLKDAVGRRYLPAEADRDSMHCVIALYFEQRWTEPSLRALDELPHQLTKGNDWDGLDRVLCDLRFIEAKCAAGMTYDLVHDYDIALDSLPEAQPEKQERPRQEARVKKYTQDLIAYAGGEIKTLDMIPAVRPRTEAEIEADSQRIISSPSRLDRIRAFSQFVNSESHALLKFAVQPGFCIQHAYNLALSGPVAVAAESGINACANRVLLLHLPSRRYRYNPHPGLLRTLEGHTDVVESVAITPDGRRAVSGSHDKTLRVWDLQTGQCLRILKGHTHQVRSVAITPDGRRAVSGGGRTDKKTLRVWDLETGQCLRETGQCLRKHEGWADHVWSLAITPDGRRAVCAGTVDGTLGVWDLETGRCLRTFEGHADVVESIALTADGRRAVSGSQDKTLRVWDLKTGKCLRTLEGHTDQVWSVAITPDGKRAVSGSWDKTLRIWDLETGECLVAYQAKGAVTSDLEMNANNVLSCETGSGDVVFVKCHGLDMKTPIATAVVIWLYGGEPVSPSDRLDAGSANSGLWDDAVKAICAWCGGRFPVANAILDAVRSINRDAGLKSDQSPCLNLPAEAWDEPRLLSECQLCHKPLKFNPFIVDNRGRY